MCPVWQMIGGTEIFDTVHAVIHYLVCLHQSFKEISLLYTMVITKVTFASAVCIMLLGLLLYINVQVYYN
jgi:hypothetical protein